MRVHNLTDVSTPALVGAGLVNVSIKLGSTTIAPGQSADMKLLPADIARYRKVDAIFVGPTPPARYLNAKAAQQKPAERKQLVVESKVEVKDEVSTAPTEPPTRSRRPRSGE